MGAIDLKQAADDFWAARQPGGRYPLHWQGKLDQVDGYRIMLDLADRHAARGEAQAGWKVGVTARAIREQFGLKEPVFACLFRHARWQSGGTWKLSNLVLPGWENELCVTLGEGLKGPGVTPERAARAVSHVAPAMEIIETRGPNTHEGMNLMIADNGQQRAFVTGADIAFDPKAHALGLVSCQVFIDGVFQELAFGEAVMDANPLASVAFLANKLAAFGRAIAPGQVVMTGSFTRQYKIDRPMTAEVRFTTFGTAKAIFA
jgi:2-keto-4-pentenoate hydratase